MRYLALLILALVALPVQAQTPPPLGAALGWKYDHAPGIFTRDGALVRWPSSLGPMPSRAEQQQIIAEYEASLAAQAKEPADLTVIIEVLKDAGVVTDQLIETKRQQLRTR